MHTYLFLCYGNFLCNHGVISNQCTTILKYIDTNTNMIKYRIVLSKVYNFQSQIFDISDAGALWCHGLWYMPSIY